MNCISISNTVISASLHKIPFISLFIYTVLDRNIVMSDILKAVAIVGIFMLIDYESVKLKTEIVNVIV